MNYAPIAIFAFNRPRHLEILFQSLLKNPEANESSVTVFLDHPRGRFRTPENLAVEKVANRYTAHFAELRIKLRPYNFGLSHNILNGVSEMLRVHERVIVLEDDLELSPDFLRYMNEALEKYANNEDVASIHAYVYPGFDGGKEAFFVRGADCWGWGTWRRAWAELETDGQLLYDQIVSNNGQEEFDLGGYSPYLQMLSDQIQGRNNSWAVRWYASAFVKHRLTLYPPKTMVRNTGLDDSGTHCSEDERYQQQQFFGYYFSLPERIAENQTLKKKLALAKDPQYGMGQAMKHVIKRIYRKLFPRDVKYWENHGPWQGDYPSWDAARQKCKGYDADEIAEKCLSAARSVVEGKAVAERDSFILTEKEIRWPVLAGLLLGLSPEKNLVIDFGGAFGSSFRMFQGLLPNYPVLWCVVEQELYVRKAAMYQWEEGLEFSDNLEQALKDPRLGVVLLSSSLQYVERPDLVLRKIISSEPSTIVLDRTAIWVGANRITVQTVPKEIYEASYPAWFFNEDWLLKFFEPEYEMASSFPSIDHYNIPNSRSMGYILRLKKYDKTY